MSGVHSEETDHLFRALLQLQTVDECYSFFEDICTVREIKDMSQRLEVARQLREGRVYSEIAAATGASSATISRVNRCIGYGAGGYALVLDRIAAASETAAAGDEETENK